MDELDEQVTYRVLLLIFLLSISFFLGGVLLGPVLAPNEKKEQPVQSVPCGYRIIEYGVGINCKGDTVVVKHWKP